MQLTFEQFSHLKKYKYLDLQLLPAVSGKYCASTKLYISSTWVENNESTHNGSIRLPRELAKSNVDHRLNVKCSFSSRLKIILSQKHVDHKK